jgi:hypothetical protein
MPLLRHYYMLSFRLCHFDAADAAIIAFLSLRCHAAFDAAIIDDITPLSLIHAIMPFHEDIIITPCHYCR